MNYGRYSVITNHINETPGNCKIYTGSKVMRQVEQDLLGNSLDKPVFSEEPDEVVLHVRICGGSAG